MREVFAGLLALGVAGGVGAAERCFKTTLDLGPPQYICNDTVQEDIDKIVWYYCVDDSVPNTPTDLKLRLYNN